MFAAHDHQMRRQHSPCVVNGAVSIDIETVYTRGCATGILYQFPARRAVAGAIARGDVGAVQSVGCTTDVVKSVQVDVNPVWIPTPSCLSVTRDPSGAFIRSPEALELKPTRNLSR